MRVQHLRSRPQLIVQVQADKGLVEYPLKLLVAEAKVGVV